MIVEKSELLEETRKSLEAGQITDRLMEMVYMIWNNLRHKVQGWTPELDAEIVSEIGLCMTLYYLRNINEDRNIHSYITTLCWNSVNLVKRRFNKTRHQLTNWTFGE
jgi:hypothetical protein